MKDGAADIFFALLHYSITPSGGWATCCWFEWEWRLASTLTFSGR
jgi:hypothetical protein